jgi:dTDP-4-dehydrorhamnose reductase
LRHFAISPFRNSLRVYFNDLHPVSQPIVITGAAGQLGQTLLAAFAGEWPTVGLSRSDLDITRPDHVVRTIEPLKPQAIVNCAAANAVDRAEDEQEEAFSVNALAVANLARAAAATGATLVHFSSDFVFDGETDRPYREEDVPRPGGVYAASKLVGEWLARDVDDHYVLRVESLFGGEYRLKSSVDRIVEALVAGQSAPVFVDRVVSPSYVFDIAAATAFLLRHRPAAGLYHCVNTGWCTWLELGEEIASQLRTSGSLRPIRISELPLKAPRPRYCALSNEKLRRAGFAMPTWQSALERHLARYQTSARTGDKGIS